MTRALVTITPPAAEEMKVLLNQPAAKDAIGVRVGIKSAGCSGMAYYMDYAMGKDAGDEIVEENGVKVVIDQSSLMHLLGTTIDYVNGDVEKGFVFRNPNERGRCGCGDSFHT